MPEIEQKLALVEKVEQDFHEGWSLLASAANAIGSGGDAFPSTVSWHGRSHTAAEVNARFARIDEELEYVRNYLRQSAKNLYARKLSNQAR